MTDSALNEHSPTLVSAHASTDITRLHLGSAAASAGAAQAIDFYRTITVPLAVAYLLIGAGLRLCLWAAFERGGAVGLGELAFSLASGALNDSVEFVYLVALLSLFLFLVPVRVAQSRWGRGLLGTVLYAYIAFFVFVAIAEFFFFEEFDSRFNLVAVDYLIYPTEVVGNIEQSYPVEPLLVAVAVAGLAIWLPVWRRARAAFTAVPRWRSRLAALAINAFAVAVLALGVSAEALSLARNRTANELAMNGAATFFRALRTQEIDYDTFYPTLPRAEAFKMMRDYLGPMGGTFVSPDPTSLARRFPANPAGLGKLNVVILSEESLGAQYVGVYGNTRGLTPVFDELAKEGLLFRNAYATGTRTVRGLEAMAASFPPIPSEAIVKRPGSEQVSNWGRVMGEHGYHASFLYGGYGAFDNMNNFFGSNGFALSDRLDIENPKFTNAWGVSDEDLFHHAIGYFDVVARRGAPFFSIIMTTSNHKPFTFPAGTPGIPAQGGGRDAGVRYADYAIGQFFAEARSRPWFANTLFVIIADHDSRVYGRAAVPVEHYRIPALLYAPGHLAPAQCDKSFSNMDLAPTVLALLGLPYEAPFYGVNVLDPAVPEQRPVLFSHNHDVAIYQGDRLSVVGLQKTARSFLYTHGQTAEVAPDRPALDLLSAYLQTAYDLFQARKY